MDNLTRMEKYKVAEEIGEDLAMDLYLNSDDITLFEDSDISNIYYYKDTSRYIKQLLKKEMFR